MRLSARFLLMLGGVLACVSAFAKPADSVLVHGKIVTLDAKSTVAEARAIRDGNP